MTMKKNYKECIYYFCLSLFICSFSTIVSAHDDETLITNVLIIDGTGSEAYSGSLLMKGDVIASIFRGSLNDFNHDNTVDGMGMVLAPGFLDSHSHFDQGLKDQPSAKAAITQGITTIIRGMDGFSARPDGKDTIVYGEHLSVDEFNNLMKDIPTAVNIASFSSHNSIRSVVMKDDFRREANALEIKEMSELVETDMRSGALGLSTGLEYDPGIYSSTDEVIILAKIASKYGGRYKSHMRSEDRYFWDSINEIIEIGVKANIPVNIDHLKLAAISLWGMDKELLSILNNARERGIDITADIYPYTAWQSTITVLYPDRNFDDANEAKFILENISSPDDILFVAHKIHPDYVNKTLREIASEKNKTPEEMLSIIAKESFELSEGASAIESIIGKSMDEKDVIALLNWEYSNVTTDGGLDCSHPRGCGSFTKVIDDYIGDKDLGSIERVIHKMTGLTAKNLGIQDRGEIKVDSYADLILFDPDRIQDNATFEQPNRLSDGIHSVWVNGKQVLADGVLTEHLPGKIILREVN